MNYLRNEIPVFDEINYWYSSLVSSRVSTCGFCIFPCMCINIFFWLVFIGGNGMHKGSKHLHCFTVLTSNSFECRSEILNIFQRLHCGSSTLYSLTLVGWGQNTRCIARHTFCFFLKGKLDSLKFLPVMSCTCLIFKSTQNLGGIFWRQGLE